MITSSQVITISENYLRLAKTHGKTFEIYENPTLSDISHLKSFVLQNYNRKVDDLKFIADAKTKKLYVVDAWVTNHNDVCDILGLGDCNMQYNLLSGMARATGSGKPVVEAMFGLNLKTKSKYSWLWIGEYLDISKKKWV